MMVGQLSVYAGSVMLLDLTHIKITNLYVK
jgi:hypothetical protein